MPFALNSDLKNRNRLARIIAGTRLFGDRPWSELLAEKLGHRTVLGICWPSVPSCIFGGLGDVVQ